MLPSTLPAAECSPAKKEKDPIYDLTTIKDVYLVTRTLADICGIPARGGLAADMIHERAFSNRLLPFLRRHERSSTETRIVFLGGLSRVLPVAHEDNGLGTI